MAELDYTDIKPAVFDYPIKNGVTVTRGGFVSLDSSTGRIDNAQNISGYAPLGIVVGSAAGSSLLTGNAGGTVKARVLVCVTLRIPVTGATGLTDIGKSVYISSSSALTLTAPALGGIPIGCVIGYVSGTTCVVYIFHPAEVFANYVERDIFLPLGVIFAEALTSASEQLLLSIPMLEHMLITSLVLSPVCPDASSIAGSQTIQARIGSTPITGANCTALYSNVDDLATIGVPVTGSATAANEAHKGDTLNIVSTAGGTPFTGSTRAAFLCAITARLKKGL